MAQLGRSPFTLKSRQTPRATITNHTNGRQVGEPNRLAESRPEQSNGPDSDSQAIPIQKPAASSWQIPQGVSPGIWDYVRGSRIAEDYDQFLADTPLNLVDRKILDRYLPAINPASRSSNANCCVVADLGCGTGRHVIPLANNGYRVLAVDLSQPMLERLIQKFDNQNWAANKFAASQGICPLQANLVELDALKADSIDNAICMFSTLGMIKGRENRRQFLDHVRRILKPQGQFILHVHNIWYQLRYPGGISWLVANAMKSLRGQGELGDRYAEYRGIRRMFIHSFRKSELKADLRQSGFGELHWLGILGKETSVVEDPTWRHAFQVVGWVVVCR